jgi:hypothetical protein
MFALCSPSLPSSRAGHSDKPSDRKGIEQQTQSWDKVIVYRYSELAEWADGGEAQARSLGPRVWLY